MQKHRHRRPSSLPWLISLQKKVFQVAYIAIIQKQILWANAKYQSASCVPLLYIPLRVTKIFIPDVYSLGWEAQIAVFHSEL